MPVFYDFEVFTNLWTVVIIDSDNKTETVIVNDQKKMTDFYNKNSHRIWVGYNSAHYDIYILKAIIAGFNPKKVNDFIILQDQPGWAYADSFRSIPINNFDVFTGYNGLKTLEGFMGDSIEDTTIPFDYSGIFTNDMIDEVIKYNRHDVQETIKVFVERIEEFTSQIGLIQMYKLPLFHINKSKAQLSAFILGARKRQCFDEFDYDIPDTLNIVKYAHIVDWYKNPKNKDYDKSLTVDVCGVPHIFAWGGLHGAIEKYHGKGIFMHIDVNSYYPSIMLRYAYLSRAVPSDKMFREIRELRLQYKKAHDPRANPLKIVLNSTYGAMKDKTNPLYDPRQANSVCVGGQLLLLDLLEHLEGHCDVIQSNTDGIIVRIPSQDKIPEVKAICQEWEQRTGMGLGYDMFDTIYQADVNNYLIANGENYESKGSVKRPETLDNDVPIVRTAVIEYMLHGTDPKKTIDNCDELMQYQQIVKVSKKFDFAVIVHKNGQTMLQGKHFRVFASKNDYDGTIKRGKWENTHVNLMGETVAIKADKFASTPEHCFIDNSDIKCKKIPNNLDKTFYLTKAYDLLQRFGVEMK